MPLATGGNITTVLSNGIQYKVHTFTSSGSLTVVTGGSFEILVVAGGGGGAGQGGGGGAGGLLYYGPETPKTPNGPAQTLSAGTYTITVGGGGALGGSSNGVSGGNSSVVGTGISAVARGGGGAASRDGGGAGLVGGSGGGGGAGSAGGSATGGAGTAGQGFAGANGGFSFGGAGDGGGGGGGAGLAGSSPGAAGAYADRGGNGLPYSIGGVSTYYAGGGGGGGVGGYNSGGGAGGLGGGGGGKHGTTGGGGSSTGTLSTTAEVNTYGSGRANSGGGGGGSSYAGGSGIVILRYQVGVSNRGGTGGPYGGGGGGAAGYTIPNNSPVITNQTYDASVSSSTNFTVSGNTYTSTGQFCSILFKVNQTSGKVYLEVIVTTPTGDSGYGMYYGVQRPPTRVGNYHDGLTANGNGGQGVTFAVTTSGTYGMLIDIDAQTVSWNNGTPVAIPGTGQLYFGLYDGSSAATGSVTVNWGVTSFTNTLPSGAVPFGQSGITTTYTLSTGGTGADGTTLGTGSAGTNGGGGGGGSSSTVPAGGGGGVSIFGVGNNGAGGSPNQSGGGGSANVAIGFPNLGGQPGFDGNGGLFGGGGAGGVSSTVDLTRGWGANGAFVIIVGNSYPTLAATLTNSTGNLLSENSSNISTSTSGKTAVDPDGQFKSNTVQVMDQPRPGPIFNLPSQDENNVITKSLYTPNITQISSNANVSTRYDGGDVPISSTGVVRSPVNNNQILSSNPVLVVARQPEFMLLNSNPDNLVANANLAYKYDTITPVTENNDPRLATLKVPYVVKGETGVGPDDPQDVFS